MSYLLANIIFVSLLLVLNLVAFGPEAYGGCTNVNALHTVSAHRFQSVVKTPFF
jgi:hypothetical protein